MPTTTPITMRIVRLVEWGSRVRSMSFSASLLGWSSSGMNSQPTA